MNIFEYFSDTKHLSYRSKEDDSNVKKVLDKTLDFIEKSNTAIFIQLSLIDFLTELSKIVEKISKNIFDISKLILKPKIKFLKRKIIDNNKPHYNFFLNLSDYQEYLSDVKDEELNSLYLASKRIWNYDTNRLEPNKHFIVNLDNKIQIKCLNLIPQPNLFKYVDENVFERETYKKFIELFKYFNLTSSTCNINLKEKDKKIDEFLDAILKTDVMIYTYKYILKKKRTSCLTISDFKKELKRYWFNSIKNDKGISPCGFEHVFIGQLLPKLKTVSGYHNWIKYYFDEKNKEIEFNGYLYSNKNPNFSRDIFKNPYFVNLRYKWRGFLKDVNGLLIGTSPEYEFAICTLCFYLGKQDVIININGTDMHCNIYTKDNDECEVIIATAFISDTVYFDR